MVWSTFYNQEKDPGVPDNYFISSTSTSHPDLYLFDYVQEEEDKDWGSLYGKNNGIEPRMPTEYKFYMNSRLKGSKKEGGKPPFQFFPGKTLFFNK